MHVFAGGDQQLSQVMDDCRFPGTAWSVDADEHTALVIRKGPEVHPRLLLVDRHVVPRWTAVCCRLVWPVAQTGGRPPTRHRWLGEARGLPAYLRPARTPRPVRRACSSTGWDAGAWPASTCPAPPDTSTRPGGAAELRRPRARCEQPARRRPAPGGPRPRPP